MGTTFWFIVVLNLSSSGLVTGWHDSTPHRTLAACQQHLPAYVARVRPFDSRWATSESYVFCRELKL